MLRVHINNKKKNEVIVSWLKRLSFKHSIHTVLLLLLSLGMMHENWFSSADR